MKVMDLTGSIYTGMWGLGTPFPDFELQDTKQPEWLKFKVYLEEFNGMYSQTGTYLETPAHMYGYDKSYPLIDVDVSKLVDIPAYIIHIKPEKLPVFDGRPAITKELISKNFSQETYEQNKCKAILVSTGYGKSWGEKTYLDLAPFIKKDAMHFIISKKPFLVGGDSPRWENLKNPEGFFPDFYDANILLAAPLINLEKVSKDVIQLTILPIKVEKTCCAPCRAIAKY